MKIIRDISVSALDLDQVSEAVTVLQQVLADNNAEATDPQVTQAWLNASIDRGTTWLNPDPATAWDIIEPYLENL